MNPFCPKCGKLMWAKSRNYEIEGELRRARSKFWVCPNPKCKKKSRMGRDII